MSKPWRLTRTAEASLIDIARWTFETIGPRQADAYEEDLIATCRDIAAGTSLSQDCRRLIDPNLVEDLCFSRCGQHFIVFAADVDQVIIIDFLYSRSDLPGKLAALQGPRPERNR